MDSKLIDALLIELLKLPEHYRTPEKILANLTLAATAAGVSLSTQGAPLQLEHLKLHAALGMLSNELGDAYTHRATLRLGNGLEGIELGGVIEPREGTTLPRFFGFGANTQQVLAKIKAEIQAHHQPNSKPPVIQRRSGPLSKLKRAAA